MRLGRFTNRRFWQHLIVGFKMDEPDFWYGGRNQYYFYFGPFYLHFEGRKEHEPCVKEICDEPR